MKNTMKNLFNNKKAATVAPVAQVETKPATDFNLDELEEKFDKLGLNDKKIIDTPEGIEKEVSAMKKKIKNNKKLQENLKAAGAGLAIAIIGGVIYVIARKKGIRYGVNGALVLVSAFENETGETLIDNIGFDSEDENIDNFKCIYESDKFKEFFSKSRKDVVTSVKEMFEFSKTRKAVREAITGAAEKVAEVASDAVTSEDVVDLK